MGDGLLPILKSFGRSKLVHINIGTQIILPPLHLPYDKNGQKECYAAFKGVACIASAKMGGKKGDTALLKWKETGLGRGREVCKSKFIHRAVFN